MEHSDRLAPLAVAANGGECTNAQMKVLDSFKLKGQSLTGPLPLQQQQLALRLGGCTNDLFGMRATGKAAGNLD